MLVLCIVGQVGYLNEDEPFSSPDRVNTFELYKTIKIINRSILDVEYIKY